MSDPWSRPVSGRDAATPRVEPIEIELIGSPTEPGHETTGVSREPATPNWRRIVAMASLAGVAAGLVAGAFVLTRDGETADEPPTTTVDPESLATLITTPPTLPPVVEDVPATSPPTSEIVPEEGPAVTIAPPRELRLVEFPVVVDSAEIADRFEFRAVDAADARRTTLTADQPDAARPTDVTIDYDPDPGLFRATYRYPSQTVVIIDAVTGVTFMAEGRPTGDNVGSGWRRFDADGADVDTGVYFRNLLLGPVRTDGLQGADVEEGDVVQLDDGRTARRFTVTLPASDAWNFVDPADDATVTYDVYVTADGEVALVQGINEIDGLDTLISLRFESAPDVEITLPDPATVVSDEMAPDPAGAVATTDELRPAYPDAPGTAVDAATVEAALDLLVADPPTSSSVVVRQPSDTLRFVGSLDSATLRRLLRSSSDRFPIATTQIDARDTSTTYYDAGLGIGWTSHPYGDVPPIDLRLITGPIAAGALVRLEVVGEGQRVQLDDGTVADEFRVTFPSGMISLPFVTGVPLSSRRAVDAFVYVSDGEVVEVQILANVDPPAVYVQRFTLGGDPVSIELPADALPG